MKTLYHGSNIPIEEIDLSLCKKHKDFGKGFYLTELKEQAEKWAGAISKIRGGKKYITVFSYNNTKEENINLLKFEKPTKEWAYFIMNNRNRHFQDTANPLSNFDNKYDVVEGPVGNDDIATLLSQFVMGIIDDDYLMKKLEYKKLNHQISFHTKKSILLLTKLKTEEIK